MGSYQEIPFHTPQHHRKVSSASPSPSQTPRFGRERGERSEPPRVAESFSGRLFDKERGVNGQRERGEKSESRVAESLSARFFERERDKGFFDKEKGVNVQVLLRCRPLSEDEVRAGVPQVISCNEQKREVTIVQNIANKPMDRSFTFDKVYGPKTQQRTLYEQSIFPIVNEVLEGYNCTIFAYGQTGTGKTYTMEGAGRRTKNGELPSDAGVIPRAVKQIIDTLESQNADYSMKITFLELYNEEITDLLANDDSSKNPDDKSKKSVALLEDAKGGVQVRGLEEEVVYSANEIYNLIERGSAKRRTGETLLNKQSSRSHSIFSITIHIKETTQEGEELIKSGKLNLVDLAGSEDISRSGAREGRAREAGEINKSLLTLGRVITALVEHLGHVPYRDSKLTRLLKDSLGGKTKTCIIATISPSVHSLEETLSTLDYAYRAKSIRNKPEANQKTLKSSFIKDLHMEIERLKQDVRAAREKNGVYLPRDRYLQEEAEKKLMTEKIYRMECEVEFKDKHMNELQEMHNFQQKTIADLQSKLEAAHTKIEDTEELLRDLQEKCRQANYTIKEKEFIISNMLQSEKSLVEQATALQSDLEIASEDIDGLFAKIDRKDNIESGNQNLVQTFKSKLLQHLEVLHKSVTDSVSQQTQHLRSTEEQLQSFVLTKDQATEEMKNRVDKLKTTYCSGIKGLQDLVNELDKKTLATFGGVNLTVNSQASAFNDLLESAVSEADAILIELQTALGKQEEKLSSYAQEQRERIKRTVESTRTISKIIVDFFENLQKHASTLCQFVEETQTVHDKNLVDLKKSYEELVAYEEKQTLEKISEILASSRARKTELMCTAVHNLRETAADKAHDLQEGMVDMQKITSNAQDEWTLYMKQAEDNYVEDTISVEAGQRSIGEILHDCTVKTTAVEIQWKNTQVSLQQKGKSNVEEVDSIVKRGMEANQVVLSDLTHTASSAHEEIENGMGGLLSGINESLKLDRDAFQSIQPTIASCTNDLVELQNSHNNKVEEITKDTDKYLVGEYLEDQPTCTTPKRRSICVPSVDSIEKLQTPCFEELVQAFEDAKSERRLKYGNGEVKQLYASPDVTPVRDARIPLTTLN